MLISKIERQDFNFEQIIDEEKLIVLFAVGFVFDSWHHFSYEDLRFYYNPLTNLLEPILRELEPMPEGLNKKNMNKDDIIIRLQNLIDNNSYLSGYLEKHINDSLFISTLNQTINDIMEEYLDIIYSNEFNKYITRLLLSYLEATVY